MSVSTRYQGRRKYHNQAIATPTSYEIRTVLPLYLTSTSTEKGAIALDPWRGPSRARHATTAPGIHTIAADHISRTDMMFHSIRRAFNSEACPAVAANRRNCCHQKPARRQQQQVALATTTSCTTATLVRTSGVAKGGPGGMGPSWESFPAREGPAPVRYCVSDDSVGQRRSDRSPTTSQPLPPAPSPAAQPGDSRSPSRDSLWMIWMVAEAAASSLLSQPSNDRAAAGARRR